MFAFYRYFFHIGWQLLDILASACEVFLHNNCVSTSRWKANRWKNNGRNKPIESVKQNQWIIKIYQGNLKKMDVFLLIESSHTYPISDIIDSQRLGLLELIINSCYNYGRWASKSATNTGRVSLIYSCFILSPTGGYSRVQQAQQGR